MAGRDFSNELFPTSAPSSGRDFSAELFGEEDRKRKQLIQPDQPITAEQYKAAVEKRDQETPITIG